MVEVYGMTMCEVIARCLKHTNIIDFYLDISMKLWKQLVFYLCDVTPFPDNLRFLIEEGALITGRDIGRESDLVIAGMNIFKRATYTQASLVADDVIFPLQSQKRLQLSSDLLVILMNASANRRNVLDHALPRDRHAIFLDSDRANNHIVIKLYKPHAKLKHASIGIECICMCDMNITFAEIGLIDQVMLDSLGVCKRKKALHALSSHAKIIKIDNKFQHKRIYVPPMWKPHQV